MSVMPTMPDAPDGEAIPLADRGLPAAPPSAPPEAVLAEAPVLAEFSVPAAAIETLPEDEAAAITAAAWEPATAPAEQVEAEEEEAFAVEGAPTDALSADEARTMDADVQWSSFDLDETAPAPLDEFPSEPVMLVFDEPEAEPVASAEEPAAPDQEPFALVESESVIQGIDDFFPPDLIDFEETLVPAPEPEPEAEPVATEAAAASLLTPWDADLPDLPELLPDRPASDAAATLVDQELLKPGESTEPLVVPLIRTPRAINTPRSVAAAPELEPAPLEEIVPEVEISPAAPAQAAEAPAEALPGRAPGPHFRTDICPRCGLANFSKGSVITYGGDFWPAFYAPARFSLRRLRNALRPRRAMVQVEAQVCRTCGMVMLQVDVDKLQRIEKENGGR